MNEIISDKRQKFFRDRILMENYFEGKLNPTLLWNRDTEDSENNNKDKKEKSSKNNKHELIKIKKPII